jgi:hypothetical protein
MIFEISVILATIIVLAILRVSDKKILSKFLITIIGVLLFEYLTSAMWVNQNLESWAYLYKGVSWVITLGWASIILVSVAIINFGFKRLSEGKRFVLQLILVSIIGFLAEMLVRSMNIREYSAMAQRSMSGVFLLGLVPIEAVYYIPVFMILVLGFKRYWEIATMSSKLSGGKKK